MNTPPSGKQDDYLSSMSGSDFEDTPINEETGAPDLQDPAAAVGQEKDPLSEKEAWESTEILMNIREKAQSFGLAWYVDGNMRSWKQYQYNDGEKKELIRAWSRVIGAHRIKVSPWVDIAFTEIQCSGPLMVLAHQNRKQRQRIEQLEAEKANGWNPTLGNEGSSRRDTKTQWKIDENGFFEYTSGNTYISKNNRKAKPDLTPENYELLCKHNGKEFIDQVFKIQNG